MVSITMSTSAQAAPTDNVPHQGLTREEFKIISASCVGTVIEWYDFILFGAIAPVIGKQFFASTNPTTGLIFALLAFSAAFIIRPFGAIVFGRIGDLIGRKYTFLITILIMGLSTFAVGLLPTYASIGIAAPCILIAMRLLQGLAIGGEYGGAAVFVAEHSPDGKRGLYTSWIQTTGTLGVFLSLFAIFVTRSYFGEQALADWAWRLPFLVSILLLAISVWMRLAMQESPVFLQMKAEGRQSNAPISEAFGQWKNLKIVIVAFVLSAGFGVIWYTTQLYTLIFMTQTLKIDGWTANLIVMLSLLLATPFFVAFGWLSDKIGRKKVILSGIFLAALALFPTFKAMTHFANPALERAVASSPVTVIADPADCQFQFNLTGTSKFTSSCDVAKAKLVSLGVSYRNEAGASGQPASIRIGNTVIPSIDIAQLSKEDGVKQMAAFSSAVTKAIADAGYPSKADPAQVNVPMLLALNFMLVFLLAVAYGPVPALLVELFPTRIRYSSLSLPYHLGTGWFGGMVPTIAVAMVAYTGNIYFGLWFPVAVALFAVTVNFFCLRETNGTDIKA
ncbi:MAG: MFS transporter [Bradyrhizobiaceae bacterium]|nr:MAG: MFS transporter [Bradyrhizobiaceae bacterium]